MKIIMLKTVGAFDAGEIYHVVKDNAGPSITIQTPKGIATIPRQSPPKGEIIDRVEGFEIGEIVFIKLGTGGPTYECYKENEPGQETKVPRKCIRRLPIEPNFRYV